MSSPPHSQRRTRPGFGTSPRILERNIDALIERRRAADESAPRSRRIADAITAFAGSMRFVVLHLIAFGTWIVWNLGWLGLPRFDPSFVVLAMIASVEAIFLSTFVLISQNRMNQLADERADLDLQISLLTEHEVTQLLTLVSSIATRLGMTDDELPDIVDLTTDVMPEDILDELDARNEA